LLCWVKVKCRTPEERDRVRQDPGEGVPGGGREKCQDVRNVRETIGVLVVERDYSGLGILSDLLVVSQGLID